MPENIKYMLAKIDAPIAKTKLSYLDVTLLLAIDIDHVTYADVVNITCKQKRYIAYTIINVITRYTL